MSRHRSTFVYLALALGLFCYLVFIDKKVPGTKEIEESENELFKLDQTAVTGLEVDNVHGTFIFQKNGAHWEIESPVNTPADTSAVEGVLDTIVGAQPQRIIPINGADKRTEAALKEWGLAPAAERVIIRTKNKTYKLLVGRKTAINDSVYARTSDRKNEPVRIIAHTVKMVLQKDLSDFRSRSVFDFDADKVTKIASRVADTATTPALESAVDLKDGKWTLEKPLVARASTHDVQALINQILGLHVEDFVTDTASNLSQYGFTSPSATLSVDVQPDTEVVLQIGLPVPKHPDQVYAQRLKSNSVFALARKDVDDLMRALPNVRDRHVFPFDAGRATSLSYRFGAKNGDLRSEKRLWNTVDTSVGRADIGKVTDVLTKLSQLETTPVLKDSATDLKPFGLDKPQGKIVIQSPEFQPGGSMTLRIGKDENKLLYVQNSAEPFIYTVPETAFSFLPDNNLGLLDARAINLQLGRVKSMTITSPPTPPVVLTRSTGGTWTASNVKQRMVDSVKADAQASLFCQLQAKSWRGPAQPGDGFDKPVLTIAVQADSPKPTILRVGATLPDGNHAAEVAGNPTTFELADGDYAILNSNSLEPIPSEIQGTNAPSAVPPTNAPPAKPALATPTTNAAPVVHHKRKHKTE